MLDIISLSSSINIGDRLILSFADHISGAHSLVNDYWWHQMPGIKVTTLHQNTVFKLLFMLVLLLSSQKPESYLVAVAAFNGGVLSWMYIASDFIIRCATWDLEFFIT